MWYVYSMNMKTGRQECVNRTFDTADDAIHHIARCYDIDRDLRQLGEYFYFLKQR